MKWNKSDTEEVVKGVLVGVVVTLVAAAIEWATEKYRPASDEDKKSE